jgi:hypothetical protein
MLDAASRPDILKGVGQRAGPGTQFSLSVSGDKLCSDGAAGPCGCISPSADAHGTVHDLA